VVRRSRRGPLFLLVSTRKHHWVLPKGHVEAGETGACTARREVQEEAGVRGEVLSRLRGTFVDSRERPTWIFLMAWRGYGAWKDRGKRRREWLTPVGALVRLSFEADRDALAQGWRHWERRVNR